MKTRISPTLLGVFVLCALVIAGAAILVFGSGSLFRDNIEYVLFFSGSVKGLQEGAPVTFRGVKVGTVSDIRITLNNTTDEIRIPVYVRLEPGRITTSGDGAEDVTMRKYVDKLVQSGLRAQLQLQSLVTGQLMVHLDFYPDREAVYANVGGGIPELPTIPSNFEELSRSFEQLPVQEILDRILATLEGIERFVNSDDLREATHALSLSIQEMQVLVKRLNANLDPLVERVGTTSVALRDLIIHVNDQVEPVVQTLQKTGKQSQQLLETATARIDELAPKVTRTVEELDSALQELRKLVALKEGPAATVAEELTLALQTSRTTMQHADTLVRQLSAVSENDSETRQDLARAIFELTEAARSVRILADFLQKHPETIVHGKGTLTGE